MDGILKRMLLLKKKKYAAVKLELHADGSVSETTERKGLDLVRRDWCKLAKEVGEHALGHILSGRCEEGEVLVPCVGCRTVGHRWSAGPSGVRGCLSWELVLFKANDGVTRVAAVPASYGLVAWREVVPLRALPS